MASITRTTQHCQPFRRSERGRAALIRNCRERFSSNLRKPQENTAIPGERAEGINAIPYQAAKLEGDGFRSAGNENAARSLSPDPKTTDTDQQRTCGGQIPRRCSEGESERQG